MYEKEAFCLQHGVFLSSVLIQITFAQSFDIIHPHGNNNLISKYTPSNFTQELGMIPLLPILAYSSLIALFLHSTKYSNIQIYHHLLSFD